MADLQVRAQLTELLPFKLFSIVSDNHFGYSEVAHDVFLEEGYHFLLRNGGEGFCLDPLDEIVNGYHRKLVLPPAQG